MIGGLSVNLPQLQRRVDRVAAELFTAPTWPLPAPQVRVDPHVPARSRAVATARTGTALIRINPAVAAEPVEYLRGTLAHEAAHLLLGRRRTRIGWAVAIAVPLWAVAIACCLLGVHQARTDQTSVWFAAAVVPALLALRLIAIPARRCELAADRLSSALIGPAAVVHTLEHLDSLTPPLVRLAAAAGMDSHPSPRQRARRILAITR